MRTFFCLHIQSLRLGPWKEKEGEVDTAHYIQQQRPGRHFVVDVDQLSPDKEMQSLPSTFGLLKPRVPLDGQYEFLFGWTVLRRQFSL